VRIADDFETVPVSRLQCQGDPPFASFSLSQQFSRAISAVRDAIPQQANNGQGAGPPPRIYVPPGPLAVGGYSLRLSDVWGPTKMPPAPNDFGPHFDFPPTPLNSVRLPIPTSIIHVNFGSAHK